MIEQERTGEAMPDFKAQVITGGLGYGSGAIGVENRLSPESENPLTKELLQKVDSIIESSSILVAVDKDDNGKDLADDGCGDGRGVKTVFVGDQPKKRSLHRKKVFGGGLTMGVATKIGNGSVEDSPLEEVFTRTLDDLAEAGLDFGAHTDDHAHGEVCGCGAIDKAPAIIHNALVFRNEITAAIEVLSGKPASENPHLISIFENYAAYDQKHAGDQYRGKNVMDKIVRNGKVVKELEGAHLEARIVINTVPGYTVNQGIVRELTDDKAQIFAVDEWRIREIAEKMYADEQEREQAYYSMLVYTLATAGTLTAGDLKTYAIVSNEQFATAA